MNDFVVLPDVIKWLLFVFFYFLFFHQFQLLAKPGDIILIHEQGRQNTNQKLCLSSKDHYETDTFGGKMKYFDFFSKGF